MNELKVCWQCLKAIESKEGKQIVEEMEEDENLRCDWCGEEADTLYKIKGEE